MSRQLLKNQIGQRLRRRRVELEMTQADLARASGLRQGAVSEIECGLRSLRAEEIPDILSALNLSAEWLLTGSLGRLHDVFRA